MLLPNVSTNPNKRLMLGRPCYRCKEAEKIVSATVSIPSPVWFEPPEDIVKFGREVFF